MVGACGARTGLIPDDEATVDGGRDSGRDSGRDAISEDVLPPIDVVKHDQFVQSDCPDASSTFIYLFTQEDELFSFYPPTVTFKKIGDITCPSTGPSTPYSMAVDRKGTAFTLFTGGQVYKVATGDAACSATAYVPKQLGWTTFGMGYAGTDDGGESLFVAEATFVDPSKGLGIIDTSAFKLNAVGPFSPPLPRCELTGTGDGRLYAFCLNQSGSGSIVAEIDKATAKVVGSDNLSVGNAQNAFAFSFWGGDFYIFTAGAGTGTTVTRYDPVLKTTTTVAKHASTVVGAGVSTCAPQ